MKKKIISFILLLMFTGLFLLPKINFFVYGDPLNSITVTFETNGGSEVEGYTVYSELPFEPIYQLPTTTTPDSMLINDFNDDGYLDIITS